MFCTCALPVVFSCMLSQALSLPPPPQRQINELTPDNPPIPLNSVIRGQVAATNIGDIFRSYAIGLSNVSNSTGSSSSLSHNSGKKAAAVYIQNTNNNNNVNNNNINNPNNDVTVGFGFRDLGELVQFLVNVTHPIINRFLGGSGPGTGGTTYRLPLAAYPASGAPPPPTLQASGTTNTGISNSGRNDLIEQNGYGEIISSTSTPTPTTTTTSKTKYTVYRAQNRASTSTPKPYKDNSDDEDETIIFNKIKHL